MSSLEIQVLFENKFRTLDKAGPRKYFQTYQIEAFLNEALDEYVDVLIKRFEVDELARRSLVHYTERAELTHTADITPSIGPYSVFYELPITILSVVESHIIGNNGNYIDVKPVTHDYYYANIDNKYKRPNSNLIWRIDISDKNVSFHELIVIGNTVNSYVVTYVKKIDKITIGSGTNVYLPDSDIKNIVNLAVQKAAQSLGLTADKKPANNV